MKSRSYFSYASGGFVAFVCLVLIPCVWILQGVFAVVGFPFAAFAWVVERVAAWRRNRALKELTGQAQELDMGYEWDDEKWKLYADAIDAGKDC